MNSPSNNLPKDALSYLVVPCSLCFLLHWLLQAIFSSSILLLRVFFFLLIHPNRISHWISSFPNSSILHSVTQSSSSPPSPKPRSLLERRLRLIIISARPRKPLNFSPSCVSSDSKSPDSIKERRMQQRQPTGKAFLKQPKVFLRKVCVDCGVHWHDSMSCEEFQILPVDERYPDDITLHRLARCGHEFCYCYGAEYRQGQHSCTCDTFNSEQETVSASSDPTVLSGWWV
ncbi:hypothetical protein HID58_066708 [Brassica napus]|uniref:Uncharacterized protein n=2 Tax=Brassica napus TaxID=3708 RepID=A0ABQ7ZGF1_BRANA|nr:hypothetical protein HID58_066708 [Brassica napus]CDY20849.1 BnaC05g26430D [Brassica napus]